MAANIFKRGLDKVMEDINGALAGMKLEEGYTVKLGGESREMEESYIFTDTIRQYFTQILESVATGAGQGFWVQAEYGAGKTHLLATLSVLLAGGEDAWDGLRTICAHIKAMTPALVNGDVAQEIARLVGPDIDLLELGSGASLKTRLLIEHARPARYVPVDISESALRTAAESLVATFPWLVVDGVVAEGSRQELGGRVRAASRPRVSLGA